MNNIKKAPLWGLFYLLLVLIFIFWYKTNSMETFQEQEYYLEHAGAWSRLGAFFLDFSRPIHISRDFFGKRNNRVGTATELLVPILHQGQSTSDTNRFSIVVHSGEPCFTHVQILWKERYPSAVRHLNTVVSGLKLLVDFYTQFPNG